MAIDSKAEPDLAGDPDTSVIENEIPAYRAVSARAVTSLVLGLCSVFCFTSLWFLLVVAGSVLFGWAAIRAIHRLPDILTGTTLAKTGIGLGLMFGISAGTQIAVQEMMLTYEATQFSKMYVDVLKKDSLAMAVWYMQPTDYRKDKSPEVVVEDLKKTTNPASPDPYGQMTAEIRALKNRIKAPNQELHFSRIEVKLADGLTHYANALLDVDGPATSEFPEKEQFALLELIKLPGGGQGDWRVRSVKYPYKPASVPLMTEKKDDDGHGH